MADERDAMIERYKKRVEPPPPPPPPPADKAAAKGGKKKHGPLGTPVDSNAPPAPTTADASALSAADRATFDEALSLSRTKKAADAWAKAAPLFTTYPRSVAVQDLRCQIAMQLFTADKLEAECKPLLDLQMSK